IVPVGEMARHQDEQEGRDKLHQPDEAEIERVVGELVHLPADRHRLHVQRNGGGNARGPELDERPLPQQRNRRGLAHGFWLGMAKEIDAFHQTSEPVFALRATTGSLRPSSSGWLASRSPKGELSRTDFSSETLVRKGPTRS